MFWPMSVMASCGTSAYPALSGCPYLEDGGYSNASWHEFDALDMDAWHGSGTCGTSVTSLPSLLWEARLPATLGQAAATHT